LEFSRPFSLTRFAPARWVTAPDDLDWLLLALDLAPHWPVAPRDAMRRRRRSTWVEMRAQEVVEWPVPRRLRNLIKSKRKPRRKPKRR
jgi:hypothetical protein